jgi:hypothetical protein
VNGGARGWFGLEGDQLLLGVLAGVDLTIGFAELEALESFDGRLGLRAELTVLLEFRDRPPSAGGTMLRYAWIQATSVGRLGPMEPTTAEMFSVDSGNVCASFSWRRSF